MIKYTGSVFIKCDSEDIPSLLKQVLLNLGFKPEVMDLYVDEDDNRRDIDFDEAELFSTLKRNLTSVMIKSKIYDETRDFYWFRYTADKEYNIIQLEWANCTMDFLLDSSFFNSCLNKDNFICAYCYNSDDSFKQSYKDISAFITHYPGQSYKVVKNHVGEDKIDISKHWGRYEVACNLTFIAAPLMWFGKGFFEIISKDDLEEFKYSTKTDGDLVHIQLFNLYDDPTKKENRNKQKEFWQFFKLEKVKQEYEKKNSIDMFKYMEEYIAKKKAKLKKK